MNTEMSLNMELLNVHFALQLTLCRWGPTTSATSSRRQPTEYTSLRRWRCVYIRSPRFPQPLNATMTRSPVIRSNSTSVHPSYTRHREADETQHRLPGSSPSRALEKENMYWYRNTVLAWV
ncbi:unnamed protein product [Fusarium graminearum]|nr:unnamed protein product [Fusarium graminearum]CAG1987003.1 unnamed protein product [Fusarium graminearum]